MTCHPLLDAARKALEAPAPATSTSARARRLRRRVHVVEHNGGRPLLATSPLPAAALTVPWQVLLPNGDVLIDVPARNVQECRRLAATQMGKLPPGTKCMRMKREAI